MTDISCPECGGELVKISDNLTQLGYIASDENWQCLDCKETYPRGIPQGDFEHEIVDDTKCGLCGTTGYLYQMHEAPQKDLTLRMKCPDCYHLWSVDRNFDEHGNLNIGYEEVMGTHSSDWGIEENYSSKSDDA